MCVRLLFSLGIMGISRVHTYTGSFHGCFGYGKHFRGSCVSVIWIVGVKKAMGWSGWACPTQRVHAITGLPGPVPQGWKLKTQASGSQLV